MYDYAAILFIYSERSNASCNLLLHVSVSADSTFAVLQNHLTPSDFIQTEMMDVVPSFITLWYIPGSPPQCEARESECNKHFSTPGEKRSGEQVAHKASIHCVLLL